MKNEYVNIYTAHGRSLGATNEWQRVPDAFDYIIFKKGNRVKAKNCDTGRYEFKDTDEASVIQNVISMLENGGRIFIAQGTYNITSTITLKSNIILEGEHRATIFNSQTTENVIEAIGTESTQIHGLHIRNISIQGNGSEQNGIYLKYVTYDVLLENIYIAATGENGVKLERSWGLTLKDVYVGSAGVKGTSGENNGIKIEGCNAILLLRCKGGSAYNGIHITQTDDGTRSYNINIISSIAEANSNYGIYVDKTFGAIISGNFVEGNSARGIMIGQDAMGITIASNYIAPPSGGGTVLLEIDGGRNIGIFHNQFGGSPTYNIRVLSGSEIEIFTNKWTGGTYLSDPNKIAKIYDPRFMKTGTATFSGDGSTTQFSISHGLLGTPSKVLVTPMSADAAGDFYVTADSTYIYVNYKTAPPSGTDNIKLSWYVEV